MFTNHDANIDINVVKYIAIIFIDFLCNDNGICKLR